MYNECKTPRELNNLKFSIWNKEAQSGHALMVGNVVEVSHYLKNNSTESLEVSALDLASMKSYDPVGADQWLDWYYRSVSSALEEDHFIKAFAGAEIHRSAQTFILPDFDEMVTIEQN